MPEPNWAEINQVKTEEERVSLYRKFEYFVHYEIPDKKSSATVKTWLDKESGLDKELVAKLKKVPDVWFSTFAKHTFIWHKTGYMSEDVKDHLIKKIPKLEHKAEELIEQKEAKAADAKPKVSIQQRMKEQVVDLCGQWEGYIDLLMFSEGTEFDFKSFNPYHEMRGYAGGVIKPNHAKIIKDEYAGQLAEARELKEWKDEDLKEAYSFTTPQMRKTFLAFYERIDSACDTMIQTGKAQRKPRKPKAVSKEKVVGKLKFQINDADLGIASINPIDIIDASEVWVYNTKTRKLGVYKTGALHTGLTVKGTSIKDFDPTNSIQKTVRKPAEQLKMFKGTAKTRYQKAFDAIKTTDTKMNGRLNDNTIILKAF